MFKKSRMFFGVYKIINIITKDFYIGSTTGSFFKRWEEHKRDLNKNTHANKHLQKSWNRYGPDAFEWRILEIITDPGKVAAAEQSWLDVYHGTNACFNVMKKASARSFKKEKEIPDKPSAESKSLSAINKNKGGTGE